MSSLRRKTRRAGVVEQRLQPISLSGLILAIALMTTGSIASMPKGEHKGARPVLELRNAYYPEISADGSRIVVWPEAATLKVYDINKRQHLRTVRVKDAQTAWLSSDGNRLAVGTHNSLQVIDVDSGKKLSQSRIPAQRFYTTVNSNLSLLAGIITNRKRGDIIQPAIRLWNIESGGLEREYGQIKYRSYEFWKHITMTRDGSIMAATKQSSHHPEFRSTVVWDVKSGRELLRLPFSCYWLALSDDGKRLATCHEVSGGTNRYVDKIVVTPQRELVVEVLPARSPFITRSYYITEIWDIKTGQKIQEIGKSYGDTPPKMVRGSFSPDGTLLATTSWQYAILWEVRTGEPLAAQLHRENDAVNKVMFSGDGQLLVAGSMGETVKVWRVGDVLEDAAVKVPASDPVRPGKP
ncbi:MAG: hypothetical protein L0229_22050 [Blastocatellia bacterium]|nr:hypothetical protein [Blastocatellia bacterium]